MGFEIWLLTGIYSLIGKSLFLDGLIRAFAVYLPYTIIGGALWFFLRRSWKESAYGFCFALLALILSRGIITELIRVFYDRPRPFQELNFTPLFLESTGSFPSGHAAFFFALAFVIMMFDKKIGWLFISLAFLNGVARVMAGVHWPTDIIGGMLVALLAFWITYKLIGKERFVLLSQKTTTVA